MLLLLLSMVDSQDEKEKIEMLFYTYQGLMYSVAYNILQHKQNAEDAVFSSWEKIICHLDKITEIESNQTKSFLVIVVERTAIDMYRKIRRNREISFEFEENPYYAVKDSDIEEVDTIAWIHSLPKKYAEILMLYYVNHFTIAEIANLLCVTESTVSRRMEKARKMLKC